QSGAEVLGRLGDLSEQQAFERRFLPIRVAQGSSYTSEREAANEFERLSSKMDKARAGQYDAANRRLSEEERYGKKIQTQTTKLAGLSKRQQLQAQRILGWYKQAFGLDETQNTIAQLRDRLNMQRLEHDLKYGEKAQPPEEVFRMTSEELQPFIESDT